ncbi:MAG: hypothetical protein Kow0037_27530 [Calditrichia bacterium]
MSTAKGKFSRYAILAFLFWGFLLGESYTIYLHFDPSSVPDTESYLKMAQMDFQVHQIHRYRPIVPLLAAATALPIKMVYRKLWPHRPESDWPVRLAFMLVNSLIMALTAVMMLKIVEAYGGSTTVGFVVILFLLCSRMAIYISGLPRVDSFYLLMICLFLLGLKTKNDAAIIIALLLGPLAKESFIFFIPLAYNRMLSQKLIIPLTLSALLFMGTREIIDLYGQTSQQQNVLAAFEHFKNIPYTFFRILSPRGIGEILSIFGILNLPLLLWALEYRQFKNSLDFHIHGVFIVVVIHIFLSGDVGRMLYLAAPVVAVISTLAWEHSRYLAPLRKNFN